MALAGCLTAWLAVQVRSSTRLPQQLAAAEAALPGGLQPPALLIARGYLLVATPTHLAVFNVTEGLSRRAPQLVLAQPLSSVAGEFLPAQTAASTPSAAGPQTVAATEGGAAHQNASDGGRELLSEAAEAEGGSSSSSGSTGAGAGAEGEPLTCTMKEDGAAAAAGASCSAVGSCTAAAALAAGAVAEVPGAPVPKLGIAGDAAGHSQLPLLAADGSGLVAVGFGGGELLAVYESQLPQRIKPPPPAASVLFQVSTPTFFALE